jgi:hypothetical protein
MDDQSEVDDVAERATVISVEQLTEAAFSGVLAALESRRLRPEEFPGPILVGIIAWPELTKLAPVAARSAARSTK